MTRRRIESAFAAIRSNDDVRKYRTARRLLEGQHKWLERGMAPAAMLSDIGPPVPASDRHRVASV
jgi:hypothetical protein